MHDLPGSTGSTGSTGSGGAGAPGVSVDRGEFVPLVAGMRAAAEAYGHHRLGLHRVPARLSSALSGWEDLLGSEPEWWRARRTQLLHLWELSIRLCERNVGRLESDLSALDARLVAALPGASVGAAGAGA